MTEAAMPITLLSFKRMRKGKALQGFATVRIGKSLTVHDIAIMFSNGRGWVNLPGKALFDSSSGMVLKDEKGKVRYGIVLEWSDRAANDRFSVAVLDAVRLAHPDLLGDAS